MRHVITGIPLRRCLLIRLGNTPLDTFASLELLKQLKRRWCIWTQGPSCVSILGDLDATMMNPIIDPRLGDLKGLRELGPGEIPRDGTWMRLAPLLKQAVL